jgi:hypothetical protein
VELFQEIEDRAGVLDPRAVDVDHREQAVRRAPASIVLRAPRLLEHERKPLPVERADLIVYGVIGTP